MAKQLVSLFTLAGKLNLIENMLLEQKNRELLDFRPVDWRQFIQTDHTQFEKIWKYRRQYYNYSQKSHLYDKLILNGDYTNGREALYRLLKNDSRHEELWIHNIQVIYAKLLQPINKWLTCEGHFLTATALTHIKGNPTNNKMNMMYNREFFQIDRALGTYKTFIDPTIPDDTKFLYYDNYYGNCGVDNLTVVKPELATKGFKF